VRCSLALLLSLQLRFNHSRECTGTSRTSQETRFGEDVGEVGVKSTTSSGSEDCVGMIDVGSGEVLDRGLESGKSNDDLVASISDVVWIVNGSRVEAIEHSATFSHRVQLEGIVLSTWTPVRTEVWARDEVARSLDAGRGHG
jgi:hypothetical protein